MAKISINLLPPEIMAQELKKARFYRIQLVGITIILVMVFLASLTVALRILQSRNIAVIQATLAEQEQKVSDLKDTQVALFLLKNRLNVIDQYFGISSQQSSMYSLLDKLIPDSVSVNAVTIGKNGTVTLLATVPDSAILDSLVNNLVTKETNEGKISQVSLDALNRGRDGFYRVSFKITP